VPYLSGNTTFFCPLVLALFLFRLPGCSYSENRRAKAIAHGNDLFEMHCSGCHSRRRLDLGKVPPDLHGVFDRPVLPSGRSATDDLVRSTILTGRSGIMPSFEGSLSDEDIKDIILYLHTLKLLPNLRESGTKQTVIIGPRYRPPSERKDDIIAPLTIGYTHVWESLAAASRKAGIPHLAARHSGMLSAPGWIAWDFQLAFNSE